MFLVLSLIHRGTAVLLFRFLVFNLKVAAKRIKHWKYINTDDME